MVGKVMTYESYQEWVSGLISMRKKNVISLIELENAIASDFGSHRQTIKNHKRWLRRFGFIRQHTTGLFELIPDPREDLERRLKEAEYFAEKEDVKTPEQLEKEAEDILNAKPKEEEKDEN